MGGAGGQQHPATNTQLENLSISAALQGTEKFIFLSAGGPRAGGTGSQRHLAVHGGLGCGAGANRAFHPAPFIMRLFTSHPAGRRSSGPPNTSPHSHKLQHCSTVGWGLEAEKCACEKQKPCHTHARDIRHIFLGAALGRWRGSWCWIERRSSARSRDWRWARRVPASPLLLQMMVRQFLPP